MYGRVRTQDQSDFPKDPQTRFGIVAQLQRAVARGYTGAPMNLTASNKPSEHNIGKMPRFIPVSQLANQAQGNQTIKNLLSHRIHLRPGSQSLGGT